MGKRGKGTKRKSSHGITLVAQGQGHIKRTQQSPFDPAGSDDTTYYVRESDKGRTFERCNPNSDSEEDELEDGPQQPDQFEELRAYREMPDEKADVDVCAGLVEDAFCSFS
ncbi:hypothetical protein CYMTET_15294 [Cymbomonas tetramitiformis]|uniref:Uncharacterized protein n=1 Tax=Cymbomonas tetramitiformis TaxID=36881 RepID=A0AAE0GFS7_9CHLO|nr:hypothetical protein CYMTET_15294 [Cymbomonas tetramitiformis]